MYDLENDYEEMQIIKYLQAHTTNLKAQRNKIYRKVFFLEKTFQTISVYRTFQINGPVFILDSIQNIVFALHY